MFCQISRDRQSEYRVNDESDNAVDSLTWATRADTFFDQAQDMHNLRNNYDGPKKGGFTLESVAISKL